MIQEFDAETVLINHKNILLRNNIYNQRRFECCPYCNCKRYIKYGFYKGIQRYQCKNPNCHKTFSKATDSIFEHSKKDISTWVKFIELFLEHKTLRECAEYLEINISTAFFWRHKILNCIKSSLKPDELKGDTFISTSILNESISGNVINTWHNGRKVEIMTAMGQEDSILIVPMNFQNAIYKEFNDKVYPLIDKESYIISYEGNIFSGISKNHNNNLNRETNEDNEIIKHFGYNLFRWMRKFCGIKRKYLENYISYFILFVLNKKISCLNFAYYIGRQMNFIKCSQIKNTVLIV